MTATDDGAPAQRSHPSLSVVVISYRSPDLVADCIASVAASTRRPHELLAVDADPDGPLALSTEMVGGLTSIPTRVLSLPSNPGYAAACNRAAEATSGDWLLFMNADVKVDPTCLERVLDEAESDEGIGIATCALVLPDGRLDHACHRGIPTPLDSLAYKLRLRRLFPRSRRLGHYTLAWLDPRGTHDIEACTGAFLLIRRSLLEAVGGWDERYWFYAEDLDLCLRVARTGARVRYVGSARAVHLKGASSHLQRDPGKLDEEQRATRKRVQRAIVESHALFYREHMEQRTSRLLRPLLRGMFALQRRRLERAR